MSSIDATRSDWPGADITETPATEKLALDSISNLRPRKTKCDRIHPCSVCVKSNSQCTYKSSQRVREKKQRILISNAYESRLEHISDKIDALSERMRRLDHGLLRSAEGPRAPVINITRGINVPAKKPEAESIDSTLFAHVIQASKFIQAAVAEDPHSEVGAEMSSVLDVLRNAVQVQQHQTETLEDSRPFSRDLPPGLPFKDLPIPPLDRIMAVLRVAHDRSPGELYWPFEFGFLGDFTKHVIKACSPGPATEAELIMVHYILHWLFTECSESAHDTSARQDYTQQAITSRNSLETILSNLSIHLSDSVDTVCALYMAALYSLQCGKLFMAWTFISRASLVSQALGLHSSLVVSTEPSEEAQRKRNLFWAVYVLEKSVSLRLGRPSTIRDRDITLPRLRLDRNMASLSYNKLPDWIEMAELYGRVYEDIYSPPALAEPVSIRESRINALASDLKRMMAMRAELYKHPGQWSNHVIPPRAHKLAVHANRATEYSILASIYRGIVRPTTFGTPSMTPCTQCISAARAALAEAKACIVMLTDPVPASSPVAPSRALELWISQVIQTAMFIPFLILFCNTVATSASSDLAYLRYLVEGLHSIALARPPSDRSSGALNKQLRIFRALYHVAAKYVETKSGKAPPRSSTGNGAHLPLDTDVESHFLGTDSVWFGAGCKMQKILKSEE
ncbi:hypothetical protein BDW74DRAFT_185639 [Aspergillus multicolor]|uniref:Zn(II)2Cys6 transcription factor n=1 Tax=Aspergillus multicolor TaxID=41759 RepID=UPI003CCCEA8D